MFPQITNNQSIEVCKTVKLIWFSQYIGFGRGLEYVFTALNEIQNFDFELHIIGFLSPEVSDFIQKKIFGTNIFSKIKIHSPLPPDQLISFINQFDIGLAIETGQPLNRDICLSNKIFSYIQAGLAVLATNTTAQKQLLSTYPTIGKLYDKNSTAALTNCIKRFYTDPKLLLSCKKSAFSIGQTTLNWETESIKFLSLIAETLT
ncbi:MAG: hypothetical protein EOP42_26890 [Sphingobacteriaceae bacterium]|nr:MAG: hypothetical protein EOP42_26890 [Sphingobacteriaceae bacterium]